MVKAVRPTTPKMAEARGQAGAVPTVSSPSLDWSALPPAVARLRTRILGAAAGGAIDDLLVPIQWNEVPPLFMRDQPQVFDPIAFLKARSFDGEGREMLRILNAVFRQPFAIVTKGMTTNVVWPAFPVVPEVAPRPQDRLAPWRCVRFADLARQTADGNLLVHRAVVGIDGTWHAFWTEP